MNPKIKLHEIRLLQAKYSINESFVSNEKSQGDEPVQIKMGCWHSYDKEKRRLKVKLTASCNAVEMPYEFDVTMGGIFSLDSDPEDRHVEGIANVYCAAIIFPYLRECVSNLVSRGGDDPLYLPVINFVENYKDSKKQDLDSPTKEVIESP